SVVSTTARPGLALRRLCGPAPMPPEVPSSMRVFHSPQASHLPAQRECTVPQFWQTNWNRDLAVGGFANAGPTNDCNTPHWPSELLSRGGHLPLKGGDQLLPGRQTPFRRWWWRRGIGDGIISPLEGEMAAPRQKLGRPEGG